MPCRQVLKDSRNIVVPTVPERIVDDDERPYLGDGLRFALLPRLLPQRYQLRAVPGGQVPGSQFAHLQHVQGLQRSERLHVQDDAGTWQ